MGVGRRVNVRDRQRADHPVFQSADIRVMNQSNARAMMDIFILYAPLRKVDGAPRPTDLASAIDVRAMVKGDL